MSHPATPVVVAGAGPTGLTCALLLARRGVEVHVIDSAARPVTEARAMFLHVRTLELWDRLGIADTAVRRGAAIDAVSIWRGGRHAATMSVRDAFAGRSAYPHSLGLPQDQTQRLLLEALTEHPTATVRWGARLTGLDLHDDHVTVHTDTPGGPAVLRTRWLVAADGGSSTVRGLLGIDMPGRTYEFEEFGVDVDLPAGLPTDQMITSSSAARGLSVMPIGAGRFRVFGTVTPDLRELLGADSRNVPLGAVTAWMRAVLPTAPAPTAVHRSFAYRIHRRVADRFRHGRVFLAGDAAHMNAPAGGQGINLGMGDGFNLGWKLALVTQGLARDALLDTYEAERRPLAVRVVAAVDRVYRADTGAGGRLAAATSTLTNLATAAAVRVPLVRDTIADAMSQTWIHYRRSPATLDTGRRARVRAGDRLPTAALPDALRGTDLTAVLLDGRTGPAADDLHRRLVEALAPFRAPIPIHRETTAGPLHHAFGTRGPLVALVRPDGHLLYRGADAGGLSTLVRHLDRYLTRPALGGTGRGPSGGAGAAPSGGRRRSTA